MAEAGKAERTTGRSGAGRYHHGNLKAALRDAAERILIERGVAEVGLREVARAVGVSHAAPYRHYENREALLADIAAGGFERLRTRMAAVSAPSPQERVAMIATSYVGFAMDEPAIFRLMFGPELAKPAHPQLKIAADATFAMVREAMIDFGVPPPATIEAIASWALVHGYATLLLDDRLAEHAGDLDPAEMMRRAGEIFVAGVSAKIAEAGDK